MLRPRNAHKAPDVLNSRELAIQTSQRMARTYRNVHSQKHHDIYDLSPDFRWRDCCRLFQQPVETWPFPIHDYGPALLYLEMAERNIDIPPRQREPQYAAFCAAKELYETRRKLSPKWDLEALLCTRMNLTEISLEQSMAEVDLNTIAMYDYYFFDIRNRTEAQIVDYIDETCEATTHDAVAKYVATLYGTRMYKHYRAGFSTMSSDRDRTELRRMSASIAATTSFQALMGMNVNLRDALSIMHAALKETIVQFKIETASSASKGGTGMSSSDDIDTEFHNVDDIWRDGMAAIEDQRALEVGGLAAANSIEDAQKTHFEAVIETITAPEDVMTPEELQGLEFSNEADKKT